VLRTVSSAEGQFEQKRTQINFQPIAPLILDALDALLEFQNASKILPSASTEIGQNILSQAEEFARQTYLGMTTTGIWGVEIYRSGVPEEADFVLYLTVFMNKLDDLFEKSAGRTG
jgi:hypothetical protein